MKRALQALLLVLTFSGIQFSAKAQQTKEIVSNYLKQHASEWNLQSTDFNEIEIVSESSSLSKGAKHVYIRQVKDGMPIVNGLASVTVKNNQVVYVASSLVSLETTAITAPAISADQAVKKAFESLGLPQPTLQVLSENKQLKSIIYGKGSFSNENIPVRLFLENSNGKLSYVWDLSIYPVGGNNWWSMRLSAADGTVIFKNNWMSQCSFENCGEENHTQTNSLLCAPPPPAMEQYAVYPLPTESPNHGPLTTIPNPADNTQSPFGWHDTNGSAGAEFTITRGNNAYAYEDKDNDNIPGFSPEGGPSLDFGFPYDSIGGVEGNLNGVITNLFYMNNMMHDIWAYYGFDEESGNFQAHNYLGVGSGNDYVLAEAQDGSGTDNANFGTPPDGSNPRMQMYLWNFSGYLPLFTVNGPDSIAGGYPAGESNMGPSLTPTSTITADLVLVIDDGVDTLDGCGTILNGPDLNGKIAVLRRGNCGNSAKVLACQNLGALAVVALQPTNESPGTFHGTVVNGQVITIPSMILGKSSGDILIEALTNGATVNVTLGGHGSPDTYDSDFDNGVIAHEYGHGISNRLIGGSGNTNCMYNAEQLGEGWSDWFALMVTMKPGDQRTDKRGIGTYVVGQPITGVGIRPTTYTTNFAYNNVTLAQSNSLTEAHDRGYIWTSMLWELTWDLIDKYGYDPDIKHGTGGNNVAMALVIEGLKMTECGGGFEDARNGILNADEMLYGSANECLIWSAFARRGLGASASQGDPDDAADQTAGFDIPLGCTNGLKENSLTNIVAYPNPGTGEITIDFSNCNNPYLMTVVDLTGNVILTQKISDNHSLTTDFSELNNGLYLIRVTDNSGVHVIEWVKQ